jgi:hypothetical protein
VVGLVLARFSKESAARYLRQRGVSPEDDPYAGLHIKDPDGINVQIFYQRRLAEAQPRQ